MKLKELFPFLLLFILLLVPFGAYFLRPGFVGSDPYGFLLFTCQNNNLIQLTGIQKDLFSALPCDFIVLKSVLFLCAFVSGAFIILLARLYSKNWHRAAYLIFLSPVFVLEFAKLENEQFAFPFLFGAVFFFFYGLRTGKRLPYLISLALVFVASFLWDGAVYYPIAFTLNVVAIIVISGPLIYQWRWRLIDEIIRTPLVHEDMPLKLHMHFGLIPGVLGLFFEPVLMAQGLFFFAMGAFSAKFWILSLPYLVVGMVSLLDQVKNENLVKFFSLLSIFALVGITQSVYVTYPTQNHVNAVDYALEISEDGNINNDWGLGYLVKWKGGETESFMTAHLQQDFNKGIVVTVNNPNCQLLKMFQDVGVYRC